MGIFDRMGKVISSNVNALLDKADDPKKSVDLLIEEMRDQIKKGRGEVVSALAAEKQLRQKVGELDGQIDKWQHRAEGMKEAREALDPGKARGGMSADELEAKFAELEGKSGGGSGAKSGSGDSDIEDELKSLRKKFRVGV